MKRSQEHALIEARARPRDHGAPARGKLITQLEEHVWLILNPPCNKLLKMSVSFIEKANNPYLLLREVSLYV